MTNKQFPEEFIFGTALASYQVEGGIYNNDWTHWENKKDSVCAEPCNDACKHYEFYKEDIELLCLLYTSPSPRDLSTSRMPSSA